MKDPNNPCLFCNSKASGIAHENNLAYASYDTYPVSEQHCLIIPKRHVADYFELSDDEIIACNDLIKIVKQEVLKKDILVNSLKEFDEILLIGSGKGVTSVQTINEIKWKRKSLKFYNILSQHYKSAVTKCVKYK